MSYPTLFDDMRAAVQTDIPLLEKGDDPKLIFDPAPEDLHALLVQMKDGNIRAIIFTDFVENPRALGQGALRLAREIMAETCSSKFQVSKDGIIRNEQEEKRIVTKFFPAALKEAMKKFCDLQEQVDSVIPNFRQRFVEISAQFGSVSCMPYAPDMHTHAAGVLHLNFGNAELEVFIGDMSDEDQAYLMHQLIDDHVKSYRDISARPDLVARLRRVPENWMVIQGHDFYHRSPTSVLWEGHDRLTFLSL